jgi:hypothetical protein
MFKFAGFLWFIGAAILTHAGESGIAVMYAAIGATCIFYKPKSKPSRS